jgi:hypothetical protein
MKRKAMRDEAIEAANLFTGNVDAILKQGRRLGFTAELCLKAIETELHSGVQDTIEKAHNEMQGYVWKN